MLTEDDIRYIKQYVDKEIFHAFGDILGPNPDAINAEEEDGVIYLAYLIDDSVDIIKINLIYDKNKDITPAVYIYNRISKKLLNEPLEILTPEQKTRLNYQHFGEIKTYMLLKIYEFLKTYRQTRVGLNGSSRLKYFLVQWLKTENIESKVKQSVLKEQIQFYEEIHKQLSKAFAREENFLFYILFFGGLVISATVGAAFENFITPDNFFFTRETFSLTCKIISGVGVVGIMGSLYLNILTMGDKILGSLPSGIKGNFQPRKILENLSTETQRLNSQLTELQQSQLSTTAQMLQATPAQESVIENVEQTSASSQLRHRNVQQSTTNEDFDKVPDNQSTFLTNS